MRTVRDIGYVRRRRAFARWSALIGFLFLASTFGLIFFPKYVVGAYGLLIVGFLLFNVGMQQLGKWSNNERHQRNDLAIDERLKGLSDRFTMLHYVKAGKHVVEHMLQYPGGLLVITARDIPGSVIGRGRSWRKKSMGLGRFFGMSGPQLGNPAADTNRAIEAIDAILIAHQLEVDVQGVIVFTSPSAALDVDESVDPPALLLTDLPEFVRELDLDPTFKNPERDALVGLFAQGLELERTEPVRTRRPVRVKRRAA